MRRRLPWLFVLEVWVVVAAMIGAFIVGGLIGSRPVLDETAAYHGVFYYDGGPCDYEVTWSGRYRPAPPDPCRARVIEYMERWLPIILPDGRKLNPPKWKPGMERVPAPAEPET